LDVGVQRLNLVFARKDFGAAYVRRIVQYLAVKIGHVHHIAIDEADCADTGCGQIECRRRTKTSRAYEEDLGLGNLLLSLATDLRQKNMSAITVNLVFSKFHDGQFANPKGCSKWSIFSPAQPRRAKTRPSPSETAGERKP